MDAKGPLANLRVIECALLSPDGAGQHLADLGADVIKVEMPGEGDYVRKVSWPLIEGISVEHLHWNRGKRSLAVDLRTDAGVEIFLDLVRGADAVIEGMRPGALDRRGLTFERMAAVNPRIVLCHLSGYGSSGPYRDLPSHGLAYDALAGIAPAATTPDGDVTIPPHTSVGIHAGPLYAALGLVSAVLRARETGRGCVLEVAQADAAVAWNWLRVEGELAYEQPPDVVSGSTDESSDERRAIGFDDFGDAVRYQYYATADGHVLLMASERKFWQNFCVGVGRPDLFERYPGREIADHEVGNQELRHELAAIFRMRTTDQWMQKAIELDVPMAPVHDAISVRSDPHVRERMEWLPTSRHGTAMMGTPIRFTGEELPKPRPAPTVGQHSAEILTEVLGYPAERVKQLIDGGVVQ